MRDTAPMLDAAAVGRIFREESGRSVAALIRVFGDIDLARMRSSAHGWSPWDWREAAFVVSRAESWTRGFLNGWNRAFPCRAIAQG